MGHNRWQLFETEPQVNELQSTLLTIDKVFYFFARNIIENSII